MYVFIVNPVAGNGRGEKIYRRLSKTDFFKRLDSKVYITAFQGHAEKIARQLVLQAHTNIKTIIVVGGDGTIHEVVNGIGNSRIPIGYIPGGSGNDFGRGCKVRGTPKQMLRRIVEDSDVTPYWIGDYLLENGEKRHFVNSIGFGFDAEIAEHANQSVYKKLLNRFHIGKITYVIALILVLFKFKPFEIEIEVDGTRQVIKKCWMVTIANHPYYGGGMKIIPTAKIQPQRMPVLIIQDISKWKILGLFLTVFTGKHTSFKEVTVIEAEKVSISSTNLIFYQVDGQTSKCNTCTLLKNSREIQVLGTNI
ncbi:diacylglycerol/lipid kinase family protein [Ornithinibacillus bavariensis]|uniref:diacylglycerol/lipid kinase family protein n=1 Tax=Ornithinibacillus bavariensis TaxID=545502 RepID=UPI003D1FA259